MVMLLVYHALDAVRSGCALVFVCTINNNIRQYYERINTSDDLLAAKSGCADRLEKLYYRLQINDLLFLIAFSLLHVFRLSEPGIRCSDSLLNETGWFLMALLQVYWGICMMFLVVCCGWRCFLMKEEGVGDSARMSLLKEYNSGEDIGEWGERAR